jgi:DNA-binding beta-propeller fold protein YncE
MQVKRTFLSVFLIGFTLLMAGLFFGVSPAWATHTNAGTFYEHIDIAPCAHCHGLKILAPNPAGEPNRVLAGNGGHSHAKQTDWTSIVNTMISKGSPAIAGVATPYFNTYYCTVCLPAWWGLKASSITDTTATVSWTTNDAQPTTLFLGTDPDPDTFSGVPYYTNGSLTTAHTVNITSLTGFTTYYYFVGAITDSHGRTFTPPGSQADGLGGSKPETASFTTLDLQPPTVPQNLHTTATGLTFITVAWDASTDNIAIAGYELYRKKSTAATFAKVGATTTATTVNNTLLSSDTSYDFKVRAVDTAGNFSDYSSVLTASTAAPPPPTAQCSDGIDNDNDGLIDYPDDPGCTSASDTSESDTVECTDSIPSRLYLSNRGAGNYKIVPVDLDTNTNIYDIVGTPIDLPDTPGELAANPKGKTLYAIVGSDLAVIDVPSNTITATIPIGGVEGTHQVVVSPDGTTAYVSYRYAPGDAFRVAVVNTSTNTVLDTITSTSNEDNSSFDGCYLPIGLGIHPTGNPLYVACRDIQNLKDRFFMIDTTTKAVKAGTTFSVFPKDSNQPWINAMAVRPDGLKVYVTRVDLTQSSVEIFDGITGTNSSFTFPGTLSNGLHGNDTVPRAAVATPDNLYLYVVDQATGTHILDSDSDTYIKTLPRLTSFGFDIAMNPDGSQVYASATDLHHLFAISTVQPSNTLLGTVTTGVTQGFEVAITPGAPGEPCVESTVSARLYLSNRSITQPTVVPVDKDSGTGRYSVMGTPIPMSSTPAQLESIPAGANKGRYLYAVEGNDLAVIDVALNEIVNTVLFAGGVVDTNQMVISPDGNTLYLAYRAVPGLSFQVKAYDIGDNPLQPTLRDLIITKDVSPNCLVPIGIGIHPSGHPLYVACRDQNSIAPDRFFLIEFGDLLNPNDNTITLGSTFGRDSNSSYLNAMAVRPPPTPGGAVKVYVARGEGTVEVFDGTTGGHSKTISLPRSATPKAAVVTLDGLKLYVVDQALGTHVIDADSDTYIKVLTRVYSWGFDIALAPDGTQIYPIHATTLYAWRTADDVNLPPTITGPFSQGLVLTFAPGSP